MKKLLVVFALFFSILLLGCVEEQPIASPTPTPSPVAAGLLVVGISDAVFSVSGNNVSSVLLAIDEVAVHMAEPINATAWYAVNKETQEFDLLELNASGAQVLFGTASLPAGQYTGIRLSIVNASVVYAVENQGTGFCGTSTYGACSKNADCKAGGCSGQVCGNKSEDLITTCEFRDCYVARNYGAKCACSENKCQWKAEQENLVKVPSQKIILNGLFTVEEGKTTYLRLDFDAMKSLVFTGEGKIVLKPVIRIEAEKNVEVQIAANKTILKKRQGTKEFSSEVEVDENGEVTKENKLSETEISALVAKTNFSSVAEVEVHGQTVEVKGVLEGAPAEAKLNAVTGEVLWIKQGEENETGMNETQGNESAANESEMKVFYVLLGGGSITPSTISVNKGDKVKLLVRSTDANYPFVIDGLDVRRQLYKGVSAAIVFTAENEGTYYYRCLYPCRFQSFKGILEVK